MKNNDSTATVIKHEDIIQEEFCMENLALACLLAADVCFISNIDLKSVYPEFYENPTYTTCVYVNCSDTFEYATTDAETLSNSDGDLDSEILSLFKLWKIDHYLGPIKWCVLKRKRLPVNEIIQALKSKNMWCEKLQAIE